MKLSRRTVARTQRRSLRVPRSPRLLPRLLLLLGLVFAGWLVLGGSASAHESSVSEPPTSAPNANSLRVAEDAAAATVDPPAAAQPAAVEPASTVPSVQAATEPVVPEPVVREPAGSQPQGGVVVTPPAAGGIGPDRDPFDPSATATPGDPRTDNAAEPSSAAPATTDPVSTDPDPAITDPTTTDPATTDPSTTDPATTDPSTTDPATTDPATTDPATTDPSTTDPATTAPATTDPASTDPAADEPVTGTAKADDPTVVTMKPESTSTRSSQREPVAEIVAVAGAAPADETSAATLSGLDVPATEAGAPSDSSVTVTRAETPTALSGTVPAAIAPAGPVAAGAVLVFSELDPMGALAQPADPTFSVPTVADGARILARPAAAPRPHVMAPPKAVRRHAAPVLSAVNRGSMPLGGGLPSGSQVPAAPSVPALPAPPAPAIAGAGAGAHSSGGETDGSGGFAVVVTRPQITAPTGTELRRLAAGTVRLPRYSVVPSVPPA